PRAPRPGRESNLASRLPPGSGCHRDRGGVLQDHPRDLEARHRRLPAPADGLRRGGADGEEGRGPMNEEKRRALEAAGFVFEDAEDFLELPAEERRLVDLRLAVSRAVRARRQQQRLTQEQLARKLKSSQSRVAKLEAGSADVSLDLMFRGLFALGGSLKD